MPIRRLKERPAVFERHQAGVWYELSTDREPYGDIRVPYGYIAVERKGKMAELHMVFLKGHYGFQTLRKVDFPRIKMVCRENGIRQLVVRMMAPDEKWVRFIKMFGFSEPVYYMASYLEI